MARTAARPGSLSRRILQHTLGGYLQPDITTRPPMLISSNRVRIFPVEYLAHIADMAHACPFSGDACRCLNCGDRVVPHVVP